MAIPWLVGAAVAAVVVAVASSDDDDDRDYKREQRKRRELEEARERKEEAAKREAQERQMRQAVHGLGKKLGIDEFKVDQELDDYFEGNLSITDLSTNLLEYSDKAHRLEAEIEKIDETLELYGRFLDDLDIWEEELLSQAG